MLIISARIGAGHDGAARELAARLENLGCETDRRDFLDAAPLVGRLIRRVYRLQLRAAPWSYEATYRVWFLAPAMCAAVVWLLSFLFGSALRRWARQSNARLVVSTYPLASVVLGHERRRLGVPVVTFVTDFAVHPLWVHRNVDLHLFVHPQSAAAAAAVAERALSPGPLVAPGFGSRSGVRGAARASLGVPEPSKVVLLVAGSWGVGEVLQAARDVERAGDYFTVTVCGSNERLRRKVSGAVRGRVLGWCDDMGSLMAAADVIVQNAGGLTCMEAFASGLPVVSYRTIPGHGRQNALEMERAGVALLARDRQQLAEHLARATSLPGRRLVAAGQRVFSSDPAAAVFDLARVQQPVSKDAGGRPVVWRRLAGVAAGLAITYAAVNVAAGAATASGLGTARPPRGSDSAYVAVRLGAGDVGDGALAGLLARQRITAIIEGRVAWADPGAVRRLAAAGVPLANGGWGDEGRLHLLHIDDEVLRSQQAIARAAHVRPVDFAPDEPVNGFDLAAAHLQHDRVVLASTVIRMGHLPQALHQRSIYVLDSEASSGSRTVGQVQHLLEILHKCGTSSSPFSSLR